MKEKMVVTNGMLLHEEVAVKDLFSHQTHQKVADSLAHLIENEEIGATVGIEGSWGGGKSTVLNLIKKALKDKAFFFIFDAWAHEENCLRRVFLESLVAELICAIKANNVEGDLGSLEKLLQTIDGRFKTTETHTTRQPTVTGILTVVFGFLSALGMSLMTMGVEGGDIKIIWLFRLGCALTGSPLLAILVWIAFHFRRFKELFTVKFWSFLDSNSTDEVTQDVSDDSERSSVEFERYFSEIMESIYSHNPDKKIIIAIDNLDRIEGTRSLALWSTLQTFLQKRSEEVPEYWFKKLWVLVPYDANGLESVWSTDDTESGGIKAKSFMDKSFQVRVEVPSPVMADWEDFAQESVERLFNDKTSNDSQDIVRMLKVTRKALSNIPTPREIKNYANQVSVFRHQFSKEIETKTIAYYVIKRFVDVKRKSVEDIRNGLLHKSFPDEQDLPYLPGNVAEQLAGIIFGVSPKDGQQLLLEPRIADALENHKVEVFKSIIADHEDGAWMAFDSYVRRPGLWKDATDIRKFLTSASCVFKCGYEDVRLRTFADICRDYLTRLFLEEPGNLKSFFDPDDDQLDITVSALKGLTGLLENQVSVRLYGMLAATLESITPNDEIDKLKLGKVADQIFASFSPELKTRKTNKAFSAEKLRQFCSSLPEGRYELSKWIAPPNSIVADIAATIRPDLRIPPYFGRVVKYVIESGINADWSATIDSVKKHIAHNNGHSADDIPTRRALDILLFIVGAYGDKYKELIKPLLGSGAFYNFISVKPEERARKAMLLLASCDPEFCGKIQPRSQVGNSQAGVNAINAALASENEDDAKAVLGLINEFGVESRLREFKHATPNKIFGAMIRLVMQSDGYEWFNYSAKDPLDSIWLYSEHLKKSSKENQPEKLTAYMDYLNSKYGVISILNEIGLANEDFEFCSNLIKYYLSTNFAAFKDTVIASLSKLSEGDYYSYLSNADFQGLLDCLNGQGCQHYLGLEYFKALSRLLEGNGDDTSNRDAFVSTVPQNSIAAIVQAMRSEYKGKISEAVVRALVAMAEVDVDKLPDYYSKVKDFCRIEDVPVTLIDKLAWKGSVEDKPILLPLVAELVERNKQAKNVWQPSQEIKDSMVEPLQKIASEITDASINEAITNVAKYYGVPLSQPETEQPDDSDESD